MRLPVELPRAVQGVGRTPPSSASTTAQSPVSPADRSLDKTATPLAVEGDTLICWIQVLLVPTLNEMSAEKSLASMR